MCIWAWKSCIGFESCPSNCTVSATISARHNISVRALENWAEKVDKQMAFAKLVYVEQQKRVATGVFVMTCMSTCIFVVCQLL